MGLESGSQSFGIFDQGLSNIHQAGIWLTQHHDDHAIDWLAKPHSHAENLLGAAGIAPTGALLNELGYLRQIHKYRTVYRGLAEGEREAIRAGNGLSARNPNAGNTPESHVAGKRDSQWISTTRSKEIAQDFGKSNGVAKIDLAKVPNQIVETGQGFGLSSKARMLKA